MSTIGLHAQLACIWEATARKPGNVHRYRDFADMTYVDFLDSAAAIAPVLAAAPQQRVGQTILDAVQATRRVTLANTNLGIILLLAPLAAAGRAGSVSDWRTSLNEVLANLTVEDARLAYQAIRLVHPGGLGQVDEQDVREEPTLSLREVMALAADRDLIAQQYVIGFGNVFGMLDRVFTSLQTHDELEKPIIMTYLWWLHDHPDSLIARKCGQTVAFEVQARAQKLLRSAKYPADLADFDAYLRADGNRRNPGTSADLTAACLFAALRLGIITVPPQYPWSLSSSA
jgi:triphosphoribosyl-dephospho-CoA synthase